MTRLEIKIEYITTQLFLSVTPLDGSMFIRSLGYTGSMHSNHATYNKDIAFRTRINDTNYWVTYLIIINDSIVSALTVYGGVGTLYYNTIENSVIKANTFIIEHPIEHTIRIIEPITAGQSFSSQLTISAQNTDSIILNSETITNFPVTRSISGNGSLHINGKNPNHILTINNGGNLNEIQIGENVYNSFPSNITISGNTTVTAKGKPDPNITVNYTNTKTPTIKNT